MNAVIKFSIIITADMSLMVFFYHYVKTFIITNAGTLARKTKLTKQFPFETAKGAIELPLIVFSHFIFCFLVIYLSKVHLTDLGIHLNQPVSIYVKGFLLGMGMMGFSSLLCRALIEFLKNVDAPNFPKSLNGWLTIARSGWLRHHLQTIEVLPIPFAILVTLGQVCCEETIFRGVLLHQLIVFGPTLAILVAAFLFMGMQIFLMPNLVSAIFPMMGSLVIGLVDGILYVHYQNLIPLIVAHISFFAVAVL